MDKEAGGIHDVESEFFRVCPVLSSVLKTEPSAGALFRVLVEQGFEGIFKKYLKDASRDTLRAVFKELARVDFQRVDQHRNLLKHRKKTFFKLQDVEPVGMVTLQQQEARKAQDRAAGLESLCRGEWASIAFAGGAGTRFFSSFDRLKDALPLPNEVIQQGHVDAAMPKGAFPISPVAGLSFIEIFIAEALAASLKAGKLARVLLMTSPNTHQQTVDYLSNCQLWGFPRHGWVAFQQAQEPRLDADQDFIVADQQGHLSWTGDGHGGIYRALLSPGDGKTSLLDVLQSQGVRHLVMHNVDNPAARPLDPQRIGFHLREQALFTMSAVRKIDPAEKVGLLMQLRSTGKLEVVEYSELDELIANAKAESTGRLLHEAGNINTHLIAVEAVRPDIEPTIYTGKKVNSRIGEVLGSSMEMLSQHITSLLDPERVRAYEVAREDFFMPTKNVTGSDSVESTTRMMAMGFARKLNEAGARVDPEALCDLHPACGSDSRELCEYGLGPGWNLEIRSRLYLCVRRADPKGAPICEGGLHLEPESTLILDMVRPFGKITAELSGEISAQASEAGWVRIGKGVVVEKGVRAVFRLGPNSSLTIPANQRISKDLEIELAPGESLVL